MGVVQSLRDTYKNAHRCCQALDRVGVLVVCAAGGGARN